MQANHSNTIRNISKEIKRECFRNNIDITEGFIYYYVELLYLDPSYGISANILANREAVISFVKMVVDQLKNQNSAFFTSIKIQWFYKESMKPKNLVIVEERKRIDDKLQILQQIIINKKDEIATEESLTLIRKRIIYYASLLMGLGNPLIEAVFLEGAFALKSIMNDDDLIHFLELPESVKKEQLKIIAHLIAGIRLLNRDKKVGGKGIPDLNELILQSKNAIKGQLDVILDDLDSKIPLLIAILDKCYKFEITDYGRTTLKLNPPKDITEQIVFDLKHLLIALHQYKIYVKEILESLNSESIKTNLINYSNNSEEIQSLCLDRVTVSSSKVFPLLEKHAHIWNDLQNEGIYYIHLSNIIKTITKYIECIQYPDGLINKLASDKRIILFEDRFHIYFDEPLVSNFPENTLKIEYPDFSDEIRHSLYCDGFDLYKFTYGDGLLIPGSIRGGVATCFNKFKCVFSEPTSFYAFKEDIYDNLLLLINTIRKNVMFIEMFNLRPIAEALMEEKILNTDLSKVRIGRSIESQTEDHIDKGYIDSTYTCNIWDLKKEALQKAKLTHCRTVSTQTEIDFSRWSVQVQTDTKKEVNSSTKTDNYTNVPKPSRYLFGLRGRTDDKQIDLELTRPVEE